MTVVCRRTCWVQVARSGPCTKKTTSWQSWRNRSSVKRIPSERGTANEPARGRSTEGRGRCMHGWLTSNTNCRRRGKATKKKKNEEKKEDRAGGAGAEEEKMRGQRTESTAGLRRSNAYLLEERKVIGTRKHGGRERRFGGKFKSSNEFL
nr:PREDICTED: uncharacterized protein LOC105663000 [Megachile rotundata]